MNNGETPFELFRRLHKLVNAMREMRARDLDDGWFKSKFLKTIIPYDEHMVMNIHSRKDYAILTPSDVLANFVTMDMLKSTAGGANAQARGMKNLALKASKTRDEESSEEDSSSLDQEEDPYKAWHKHMALAATKFWDKRNFKGKNNLRTKSRDSKTSDKKPRTSYNYGYSQHFVIDCPYENREDNDGQLIRKKAKFSPKPRTL